MLEIFRQRAVKASIIRIIIALIIIIGIQAITKFGIINYLTGPKKLEANSEIESFLGKYVTYDANYILFGYVDNFSIDPDTKREIIDSTGYVVFDDVSGFVFGINVAAKSQQKIESIIDETYYYLTEESDNFPQTFAATGTLEKMTDQEYGYFKDSINASFDSEFEDYMAPYVIQCGEVNGYPTLMMLILNAFCLIAAIYAVYILSRLVKNTSGNNIQKYLDENNNVNMNEIESDFRSALQLGKKTWSGRRWTFYFSGIYGEIISNKDIVWAYYFQRSGKRAESSVKIFTKEKYPRTIHLKKQLAMDLLNEFVEKQPHIIVGYDSNLAKTYKKDFETFLSYKYNEGIAALEDAYFASDRYNMPSCEDKDVDCQGENRDI